MCMYRFFDARLLGNIAYCPLYAPLAIPAIEAITPVLTGHTPIALKQMCSRTGGFYIPSHAPNKMFR